MNRIDQLTINREQLRAASILARSCATASARTRVLVTQVAVRVIREYLEDYYGLATADGRAVRPEFAELLDLADFVAGDWRVEVRVMAEQDEPCLLVPTMPLLVGATADIYLAVALDRLMTRVELIGFARQADLAAAELSQNGLLASLPRTSLRPASELVELLGGRRPADDQRVDLAGTWQQDATRIVDHLTRLGESGSGLELTAAELQRVAAAVRDELWHIYADRGDRMPATGLDPLHARLLGRFGLDRPVPTLGADSLLFRNNRQEQQLVARDDMQEALLRDQLTPRERIALYRHLLEDRPAFERFRQRRRLLDRLTNGRHQAPATQLLREARRHANHDDLYDSDYDPDHNITIDSATPAVSPDALDLDLFEDRYHQILTSLHAWFPGLQIEPGGDVVEHGRVIGSYFAQMELNGIPIRLVDLAKPRTQQVRETLATEMDVLALDLERQSQSMELIRLAFQC